MDKYIQELISTEKRVIVPAFGAFTIVHNSDGTTDIAFNKYLNFDDHMLSGRVAEKQGISTEEAEKLIADYAEKLNQQLENDGHTTIEGVGSFNKSESGFVDFVADANAAASVTSASSETYSAPAPAPESKSAEPETKTEVAASSTTTTTTETYYEEKRKSPTWLWIIIIVVLFLLLAWVLLFIVNKDNAVYRYFYPEQVEVVEPQPVEEVEEPEPEPAPVVEPAKAQSLSHRYNIVVGSYKEKAPADEKVARLHEKGFKDAFVADYNNEHGHWYIAVIEEHGTLTEAEARQEEIVDNYRIESWITNGGE